LRSFALLIFSAHYICFKAALRGAAYCYHDLNSLKRKFKSWAVYSFLFFGGVSEFFATKTNSSDLSLGAISTFLLLLIFFLIFILLYSPIFEASPLKATPGKYLFGLEVCDSSFRKVGIIVAMVRHMLRMIGYMFFLAGPLMCAVRSDKRALHDYLTNTQTIVRTPKSVGMIWLLLLASIFISFITTQFYEDSTEPYKSSSVSFNSPVSTGFLEKDIENKLNEIHAKMKEAGLPPEADQVLQQENGNSSEGISEGTGGSDVLKTVQEPAPQELQEQGSEEPALSDVGKSSSKSESVNDEPEKSSEEDVVSRMGEFERAMYERRKNQR
jgi:uncharacterized RDD family membrane protein YckC